MTLAARRRKRGSSDTVSGLCRAESTQDRQCARGAAQERASRGEEGPGRDLERRGQGPSRCVTVAAHAGICAGAARKGGPYRDPTSRSART